MAAVEFWCETNGDKIERGVGNHKTKFVWKILNFSSRQEQKGEFIESNSFAVIAPNGFATNWKLILYPKGTSFAKVGYCSVFLKVIDTKARAAYELIVSYDDGDRRIIASSNGKGDKFQPKEPRGHENAICIHEEFYEDNWSDVLTLVCEMSVQETYNESTLVCEMSVQETYNESKQKQCLQMTDDLKNAFQEKNSFDVTVNCGDVSFKCSKFMLTARSRVFKAMFLHDTTENQTNVVNIEDIEPKVLEEMLLYIHTGDSPNIKDLAKELLAAADYYQLDELKNRCQSFLSDTLVTDNAIGILILSDKYSASNLKKDALKYISENMKSISASSDWKKELSGYPSLPLEIIESLMNLVP